MNTTYLPLKQNYRLFNQDVFVKPYGSIFPLYGAWPYLTGHSFQNATLDASVTWMNSAETYVDLQPTTFSNISNAYGQDGIEGLFISIGGQFEFFLWGTEMGPR